MSQKAIDPSNDHADISADSPNTAGAPAPVVEQGGAVYMDALNDEQRMAVETTEGPVLVLAGAGTGKTRVLTTRLAHLLSAGCAYPSQILAVTFTNKAAREMKERIALLIGGDVEGMPWLGTFHSIGMKILRRHGALVGLKRDFAILGADDQTRLLKQLIRARNLDEKRWPARQLASSIDGWKNRAMTPSLVPANEARNFAHGKGGLLYGEYQERLKTLNAVDFGDLLLESLRLFQENPDVLAEYHRRFRYMLVDEYQDTNVVQYLWLRLIARGHGNICCVGDDDQSIYGWRGADVDNILRFETDFPGAKVLRLERNYRSTPHILAAASSLIAHNEGRLGKRLRTHVEEGEKVTVRSHWDGEEEAHAIGGDIERFQRNGMTLDEMAILVRASFQMREFEDRLIALSLPYRVIGGPRFYERAEIRDALAYLKLTSQPDNDLAFERIVNVPKRGIGEASVQRIRALARNGQTSLHRAAMAIVESDELPVRARNSLKRVLADLSRWRAMLDNSAHTALAGLILDESGYSEMWRNTKSPDAPGRLENLKELIRSMEDFATMEGFLDHVSLVMDNETAQDGEKVSLMTLHAAKGLEFDTVFLPGWEDGLFPHQRALDENGLAGLEEERRLAYVGLTRSRRICRISFARNRRIHALWQSALPSRFIDELPEAHIDVQNLSLNRGAFGWGHDRFVRSQSLRTDPFPVRRNTNAPKSACRDDADDTAFAPGDQVLHAKFGRGTISTIDGKKLSIDFERAGMKRVLSSFVERRQDVEQ